MGRGGGGGGEMSGLFESARSGNSGKFRGLTLITELFQTAGVSVNWLARDWSELESELMVLKAARLV